MSPTALRSPLETYHDTGGDADAHPEPQRNRKPKRGHRLENVEPGPDRARRFAFVSEWKSKEGDDAVPQTGEDVSLVSNDAIGAGFFVSANDEFQRFRVEGLRQGGETVPGRCSSAIPGVSTAGRRDNSFVVQERPALASKPTRPGLRALGRIGTGGRSSSCDFHLEKADRLPVDWLGPRSTIHASVNCKGTRSSLPCQGLSTPSLI